MDQLIILDELLKSYFGDQTVAEGIDEMVFVTQSSLDYHLRFLSAIDAGIKHAELGNRKIVEIIMDSFAAYVTDVVDAKLFLEKLKAEYLKRYKEYPNAL